MMRILFLFTLAWLICTAVIHRTVATDLREQEAQEIAVILNKSGITAALHCLEAKKKSDSKQCSVDIRGGVRTEGLARGILQDSGLPRKREMGLGDPPRGSSIISTPEETKAVLLARLLGEINQTLKEMPGVVGAHALVVVPDASPLKPKIEPSASVFIKYWASVTPPDENQVKLLVARAVEGLSPENVVVIYSRLEPSVQDDGKPWLAFLPSPELVLDYGVLFTATVLVGLLLIQFGPALIFKAGLLSSGREFGVSAVTPDRA